VNRTFQLGYRGQKPEREPVSYCAAAMSAWFERVRYDGQSQGKETMIEIRNIITGRETVLSELGVEATRPTTRATGMGIICCSRS
jgi:hypothetical protein